MRLFQGDLARETVYGDDPVAMAERWQREGAEWLHVVDLDGAVSGSPTISASLRAIAAKLDDPDRVRRGRADARRRARGVLGRERRV